MANRRWRRLIVYCISWGGLSFICSDVCAEKDKNNIEVNKAEDFRIVCTLFNGKSHRHFYLRFTC